MFKSLTLICQQNERRSLNLALFNDEISGVEMCTVIIQGLIFISKPKNFIKCAKYKKIIVSM